MKAKLFKGLSIIALLFCNEAYPIQKKDMKLNISNYRVKNNTL